jgi:hypothetical protein
MAGMPLVGIEENLELAAEVIPQIQAAGARVVGQLSSTMHYGDHETGLGLFGDIWDQMWTPQVLGERPAESALPAMALEPSGEVARKAVEGRPYFSYRGCISNPLWLQILKAMVRKGIDLGLDGFNTTHNYESFCGCGHCADVIRAHMRPEFNSAQLDSLFDGDFDGAADAREPAATAPDELKQRYLVLLEQAAARRRKNAFDEVFIDYGRSLRPGLLAAQWYHKYGMRANDERAALPADLWARGEDYIWYSQGPYRWGSDIEQGYIADMGLNARHMHVAGGGRPFVINKYDYRRWRVWAAEGAAHGGCSPCFHAGPPRPEQEEDTRIAPEDYYGPIIRYQRFVAEHEDLLHPAHPISQVGLVYPRRAERELAVDYLDALKRIAEWLEDAHVLYDLLFDDQLTERASEFPTLILPDIRRLSSAEIAAIQRHVDAGGALIVAGATGTQDADGGVQEPNPLFTTSTDRVYRWESTDWQPETKTIRNPGRRPGDARLPSPARRTRGSCPHRHPGGAVRRLLVADGCPLVGPRPRLARRGDRGDPRSLDQLPPGRGTRHRNPDPHGTHSGGPATTGGRQSGLHRVALPGDETAPRIGPQSHGRPRQLRDPPPRRLRHERHPPQVRLRRGLSELVSRAFGR